MGNLKITSFQDQPGSPSVEAYPRITYAAFDFTVDFASTQIIQHTVDLNVLAKPLLATDFLIGANNMFGFLVGAGGTLGGVLQVETSWDGTTYDHWRSYKIHGGGNLEGREGIELFGWSARFTIITSDLAAPQDFFGCIQLKGF